MSGLVFPFSLETFSFKPNVHFYCFSLPFYQETVFFFPFPIASSSLLAFSQFYSLLWINWSERKATQAILEKKENYGAGVKGTKKLPLTVFVLKVWRQRRPKADSSSYFPASSGLPLISKGSFNYSRVTCYTSLSSKLELPFLLPSFWN